MKTEDKKMIWQQTNENMEKKAIHRTVYCKRWWKWNWFILAEKGFQLPWVRPIFSYAVFVFVFFSNGKRYKFSTQ